METKTWLMAGIAAILVVGGVWAVTATVGDDDGEDALDLDLVAGATHSVSGTSTVAVSVVEADYELRNVGPAAVQVTLTLRGPDGALLDSKTQIVAAGDSMEVEVGHSFGSASGAAGVYTAVLSVSGAVHVSEGGVDINEDEDDEEEDD